MRPPPADRHLQEPVLEAPARRLEPGHHQACRDQARVDLPRLVAGEQVHPQRPVLGPQLADGGVAGEHRERAVGVVAFDHELTGLVGDELLDRPLRDHAPAVDDRRQVARLLDLVEQVGGDEHRPALVFDQRADHPAHVEHPAGVESVHRLVEDQQLGVRQQAARDAEPLAHPERVRPDAIS